MESFIDSAELCQRGMAALVDALGPANAARFVQEISQSHSDYTKERRTMLPDWSPEELVARSKEFQK